MRKIDSRRICIVCEGFEEIDYMNALINKAVFSDKYDFVLINSKSINNIADIYISKYQSNSYDLVLVFCDTDKSPYDRYNAIKQEINDFHDKVISQKVIIFGNPCTMQIILSHFAKIKLTSQSKSVNAKYIEELTGIVNYKANEEQRKQLFSKINRKNYATMKENVSELSSNDEDISSTNILSFIKKFENDDDSWIDEINEKL